jgi:hypothetical protein
MQNENSILVAPKWIQGQVDGTKPSLLAKGTFSRFWRNSKFEIRARDLPRATPNPEHAPRLSKHACAG